MYSTSMAKAEECRGEEVLSSSAALVASKSTLCFPSPVPEPCLCPVGFYYRGRGMRPKCGRVDRVVSTECGVSLANCS